MAKNLEKLNPASQELPDGEQSHEPAPASEERRRPAVETKPATPKLAEASETENLPEFLPTVTEPGLTAAETDPTFDSQWLTARKIKVEKADSPARYVDLKPAGWEDNPAVMIAGGWSVGKGSLKETARILYEDGRRVIIADSGKYEDLRVKTTWPEKRAQLKTAAGEAGERLKAAASKTGERLKEFAIKVKDNAKGERLKESALKLKDKAKIAVYGERPPREKITWDDEWQRVKTALIKGGRRAGAALKNAPKRAKAAIAERRARTKTLSEDLHPVIAGQAEALIDIIDHSQAEKVEIISHSAGALAALIAAQRRPELFSKLALTMPAGTFEDSVRDLLKRYRPKLGRSLTKDTFNNPQVGLSINLGGLAYILKQPFKSYREIEAITSTRVRKALVDLSKQEDVKVAVLQANADPLFPPDRIGENILTRNDRDSRGRWRKNNELLVDAYSSVNNREAGHDDLMVDPEGTAPRAALDILKHM